MDQDPKDKIAFFFDRQREFQGRAKELYDALLKSPDFPCHNRLGPLTFDSKENSIPLQAIDLFAYEAYRYFTEEGSGLRTRWQLRHLDKAPRPRYWNLDDPILHELAKCMEHKRQLRKEP